MDVIVIANMKIHIDRFFVVSFVSFFSCEDYRPELPTLKISKSFYQFFLTSMQVILVSYCCLFSVHLNSLLNVLLALFFKDSCTNIKVTQKSVLSSLRVISHLCLENKTSNLACKFLNPIAVIGMNQIHKVLCS